MSEEFQTSQVVRLFRMDIKSHGLLKAEAKNRIPTAKRKERGKVKARYWDLDDLPAIGSVFGKFKPPKTNKIIASYVPKGGTGKTAWSFNFARILALHGIKTLVVGLDFQCSLSKSFGVNYNSSELPLSLYDVMVNNVPLKDIIATSDIPTLDFIPESHELTLLERHLFMQKRRDERLRTLLEPLKNTYQVIILDCPPQWNELVDNALIAAESIICPINADAESSHSFVMFMKALKTWTADMAKTFNLIKFVPNAVDLRDKFTTSHQKQFLSDYPSIFTASYLRQAVTLKESGANHVSVLEYDPKSSASEDMYSATLEVWSELLETEGARTDG